MNPTHMRTFACPGGRTDAVHLLQAMHRVCSHDLPNQMVAVQSLLKLLSDEEAAHLGAEGREFLRRLQNATSQASRMARFLKEMTALPTRSVVEEPIALAELARELQAALQNLCPRKRFTFAWDFPIPAIAGDARLIGQAILELFAGLARTEADECRLSASSRAHADGIELTFQIEETPAGHATKAKPGTVQEKMEIVLAREWLALAGATLELPPPTGTSVPFRLLTARPPESAKK